jgi:quercetin dioxygenase-like cupin family protein
MTVQISGPDEGERFDRGNRVITIKAELDQLSANTIDFDPTFQVDQHHHDDHVDSFYVLEGVVEFLVEDDVVRAGPGTFVAIPPGTRHGFRNGGTDRAKLLNIHAPDGGFTSRLRGR